MPKVVRVEKYAQLNGHKGAVYAVVKADIPKHVFTAGSDGIIARWDVENGVSSSALAQVQAPVFSLLYDEETNLLWAGREDGGIHVIDVKNRKEIKLLKNHEKGVFSILKQDDRLYTSGGDGTLSVIDASTLQTIHVHKISDEKVRSLHFQPNTQLLYTGSADGNIRAFPKEYHKPFVEWNAHDGATNVIKPWKGNQLITAGRDARLKIWKIDHNIVELKANIPAHNYAIYQIEIYEELGIFITCSRDKNIKIWDMEALQVIKRIERVEHRGHKNSVNDFVFMKDINKLISVSDDASIIVWDIKFEE